MNYLKQRSNDVALNMIVGPNEASNLKRCLEAVKAKKNFDEIVLVYTCEDAEAMAVGREYTKDIYYKPWISDRYPFGDFGGAREYARQKTKSEYIYWLDCDDQWFADDKEHAFDELLNMVRHITDVDYYIVPYLISHRPDGKFETRFMKERIFKNTPNIFWHFAVHEQLSHERDERMRIVNGTAVEHYSTKPIGASLDRNIAITEHEIKIEGYTRHNVLFYSQDLLIRYKVSGNKDDLDKAIALLKLAIDMRYGSDAIMSVHCYQIAMNLLYARIDERQIKLDMSKADAGELFSRLSISFFDGNAEPYVMIGDIMRERGQLQNAIEFYKEAMSKEMNGFNIQNQQFYKELPAARIAEIYNAIEEPELALYFNKLAISCACEDKYKNQRAGMLGKYFQREKQELELVK